MASNSFYLDGLADYHLASFLPLSCHSAHPVLPGPMDEVAHLPLRGRLEWQSVAVFVPRRPVEDLHLHWAPGLLDLLFANASTCVV